MAGDHGESFAGMEMSLKLGCLEASHFETAAVDSVCMAAPLSTEDIPSEVNLRRWLSVNNQRARNSCCGNAVDKALEWWLSLEWRSKPEDLSARWSYLAALEWAGNLARGDWGVSIEAGVMAGHEIGAVLEKECPYWQDGERFDAILPPGLRERAASHRVASVARVHSVEEVIQSLGQRRAATVFGMAWHSGHANYQGGILRGNPGGFKMGGHAVCFVGYRDGGDILEVQNSHGEGWGDQGRMLVTHQYAQHLINEPFGAFRVSGVSGFRKAAYTFEDFMT